MDNIILRLFVFYEINIQKISKNVEKLSQVTVAIVHCYIQRSTSFHIFAFILVLFLVLLILKLITISGTIPCHKRKFVNTAQSISVSSINCI